MKSPPQVSFEYRASRVLLVALVCVTLLALVALGISAMPRWVRIAAAVCVLFYAHGVTRKLLHPRIHSVHWRGDGGADLVLNAARRNGHPETLGAVHAARVMGPLIVLTLRWPPREREHLWILPDNLDADTRRRLRMRLAADAQADLASENADSH